MTSANTPTDVAIIGGGAAGCAAAYYLAKAGVKSVVVEREGIATQASGYNDGGLNPLQGAGIPGPLSALAAESFRMHAALADALEDESGVRYHYKRVPMLFAAFNDEDIAYMQETFDEFQAADTFEARWLDTAEMRQLEPRINPAADRGLYAYGNATLLGYEYTLALWRAAERMGASLLEGEATGLHTDGSRITGVALADGGVLSCGAVVIASGPWCGDAADWLGVNIPVKPLKGEIVRLRLAGTPIGYDCAGAEVTVGPRADGLVWVASTEEWSGFDKQPSAAARKMLLDGANTLMPMLAADAEVAMHTACLRPVTADWLPIIGAAPGWDNAYLATGAGRKGILISPGIGKAIADLLTAGATVLSVGEFGAERFADA